MAQLQPAQVDLDHRTRQLRGWPVLGDQGDLGQLGPVLVKHLDRTAPRRTLGVIDLPQVQHMALHHPPIGDTAVLHPAPVAVLLAVFLARLRSQEHADRVGRNVNQFNGLGRHYKRSRGTRPRTISDLHAFRRRKPRQKRSREGRIAEVGPRWGRCGVKARSHQRSQGRWGGRTGTTSAAEIASRRGRRSHEAALLRPWVPRFVGLTRRLTGQRVAWADEGGPTFSCWSNSFGLRAHSPGRPPT